MSGASSAFPMVKSRTDSGRRDISRTRNSGSHSRNSMSAVSRTRSKTPAKEGTKSTHRAKISGRSPTPKRATCMKKSETTKESAGKKQPNSRLRVTRLAYSKNPTMNPIFSRLSKLNIETLSSNSRESNSIHAAKRKSSCEAKVGGEPKSVENLEHSSTESNIIHSDRRKSSCEAKVGSEPKSVENLEHNTENYKAQVTGHSSKSDTRKWAQKSEDSFQNSLRSKSATSTVASMIQNASKSTIEKQSQTDTNTLPPPMHRNNFSQQCGSRQSMTIRLPDQCVVPRPIRVQAAMHQPSIMSHHSAAIRREVRECRPLLEPKTEEGLNTLVTHTDLMEPSTSAIDEANVVTIPSDTYAACQAAFSYAAVSAAEALDTVLVQLKVPNASEGGITHVSKIIVPGTSNRNMSSALAVLHSSGSNSSVNSESSVTNSSSSSASSASEPEWDDGPKVAEESEKRAWAGEGSRSAGLSRPSLLWEEKDDDEKFRPPSEH